MGFWQALLPPGQPMASAASKPSLLSFQMSISLSVWKLEEVVVSIHRHASSLRNAHGSLVSLHADPSFGELNSPGEENGVPDICGHGISGYAFLADVDDVGVYLYD